MNEKNNPILTLIICTRNRAFILPECLDSLLHQTATPDQYDILVVDNNSEDETRSLVQELARQHPNVRYVFEPQTGLSHARNRGWREALTPWIGYVDDDARASSNFVERALWVIEHHDFDCFGGMYYAWYKYGKPKWLPEGFGTKVKLREDVGVVEEGFLSGGCFFIRKEHCFAMDGFNTTLGMRERIGYGEENELQIKLRIAGKRIGFDPSLYIHHCVLPDKFKLSWHIKAAFSRGRDQEWIYGTKSFGLLIYFLTRTLIALFVLRIPVGGVRLLVEKEYFIQNFMIYLFEPVVKVAGKMYGFCVKKYAE